MGFRSQFESLVRFHERWGSEADVYMVYGKEAFPAEARWPASTSPSVILGLYLY